MTFVGERGPGAGRTRKTNSSQEVIRVATTVRPEKDTDGRARVPEGAAKDQGVLLILVGATHHGNGASDCRNRATSPTALWKSLATVARPFYTVPSAIGTTDTIAES